MGGNKESQEVSFQDLQVESGRNNLSNEALLEVAGIFYNGVQFDSIRLDGLIQKVGDDPFPVEIQNALKILSESIANFTAPAEEIVQKTSCNLNELLTINSWIQESKLCRLTSNSNYFPGYLAAGYAKDFYKDLATNPNYFKNVVAGNPVAPKRLEIHSTNANCNYKCEMCLWRVKGEGKYALSDNHLLVGDEWIEVLKDAKRLGTETVIFSGGGEPLLRKDNAEIIKAAIGVGLFTMIYTNGSEISKLKKNNDELYKTILNTDWLRVSLHATTEERYAQLVGIPKESNPLTKVVKGLKDLISDRNSMGLPLKLGLGFVIQNLNHDQVENVVNLANTLGLDFLNLRIDCINVTQSLSDEEKNGLYKRLAMIREKLNQGYFGNLKIDFDDRLIALMNGWNEPSFGSVRECKVHLYRPAINPYGRVGVCDLAAEPFFSRDNLTLGFVGQGKNFATVINESAGKSFDGSKCTSCMPGQQVINSLWYKVIKDLSLGIRPEDQALYFK